MSADGHNAEKDALRTRIDYGLRVDCEKNGCVEPHSDNGLVLPRSDQKPVIERVNGHAVTVVERTVTYSAWTCPIPPAKPGADS